MKTSDIIGLILFVSFGLWWIAAPKSVIQFYKLFHKGKIGTPTLNGVRVVGVIWVVLVLFVVWVSLQ